MPRTTCVPDEVIRQRTADLLEYLLRTIKFPCTESLVAAMALYQACYYKHEEETLALFRTAMLLNEAEPDNILTTLAEILEMDPDSTVN